MIGVNDGPRRDTRKFRVPRRKENENSPGRHVVFHTAPLGLNSITRSYQTEPRSERFRKGVENVNNGAKLTHDEDDTKSFELDR